MSRILFPGGINLWIPRGFITPVPSFDPTVFGTVRRNWDYQNFGTLTLDTSGGRDSIRKNIVANGGTCDMEQTNKALQPTYNATGLNGKPCAIFDASSKYVLFATNGLDVFNNLPAVTMFSVFRVSGLPAVEGRIFSGMQSGSFTDTLQVISTRAAPSFRVGDKSNSSQGFVGLEGGTPVINTNYILCSRVVASAGAIYLYLNGTLINSNTSWQVPQNFQNADLSALWFGGRITSDDRYFSGRLGQTLIYEGDLSTSARNACFAALNTYWGTIY